MKIDKIIGDKIAKFPPATRKAIISLLQKGQNFDNILEKVQVFVELESGLYVLWYNRMLREIKDLRIDPECYAYELYCKLDERKISPKKLVNLASKRLEQHCKLTGGHNGRHLESVKRFVQRYIERCDAFFDYAPLFIEAGDCSGLRLRVEQYDKSERKMDKHKLIQLQMVKHMIILLDDNEALPIDFLKLALSTEFSNDPKILSEQVIMVDKTYNYDKEQSLVIKQMCFDFTKHILTNVISNAVLIDYLFKEDWISRETHDLLIGAYDNIKSYQMHALVYARAHNLYVKNGLVCKKAENLNVLDKYIINLLNKYADGRPKASSTDI